jgi:hypothetical protein
MPVPRTEELCDYQAQLVKHLQGRVADAVPHDVKDVAIALGVAVDKLEILHRMRFAETPVGGSKR